MAKERATKYEDQVFSSVYESPPVDWTTPKGKRRARRNSNRIIWMMMNSQRLSWVIAQNTKTNCFLSWNRLHRAHIQRSILTNTAFRFFVHFGLPKARRVSTKAKQSKVGIVNAGTPCAASRCKINCFFVGDAAFTTKEKHILRRVSKWLSLFLSSLVASRVRRDGSECHKHIPKLSVIATPKKYASGAEITKFHIISQILIVRFVPCDCASWKCVGCRRRYSGRRWTSAPNRRYKICIWIVGGAQRWRDLFEEIIPNIAGVWESQNRPL